MDTDTTSKLKKPVTIEAAKSAPKNGKAAKAKAPAKKAAPKAQRGPKPSAGGVSASDFIRSLPSNTPAKEVVTRGAEKGLKFSMNLVYAVRQAVRRKAGAPPARRGRKPGKVAAVAAVVAAPRASASAPASSLEASFRRMVLDLGLARAKALVSEVERKLASLVAGG